MAGQYEFLRKAIDSNQTDAVAVKAKRLLVNEDLKPISDRRVFTTVYEARHLWQLRSEIGRAKGHSIEGADLLVERLASLPQHTKLEQVNLVGDSLEATIFIAKTNGKFVGAIFTPRNAEPKVLSRAS